MSSFAPSPIPLIANLDAARQQPPPPNQSAMRAALLARFAPLIVHNPDLDRSLVSFQANKNTPVYSWFKYREGFSQQLVTYLLQKLSPTPGILLDPFAGAGSALFAAAALGWTAHGIEVLPVGIYAMHARLAAQRIDPSAFAAAAATALAQNLTDHADAAYAFHHIAITRGAYPAAEEHQLTGYIAYCHQHVADQDTRTLLLFAAFCILEDISYTRKDGQYLRWDARSGRSQGKRPFNKGPILPFRTAIASKLQQITDDLLGQPRQYTLFGEVAQPTAATPSLIDIQRGSCLEQLPQMATASIDFVLTSPPYANRYDYTRTYALELVYLGCTDAEVKQLRQTMLSCTVENRDKAAQLRTFYAQIGRADDFATIDNTFHQQQALQEILHILDNYRLQGELNNANISRLVHNYFYEMTFVISELARALRAGGTVAMVNDNVRYAGEEIPVDLILSDIAESFGLQTRHIWTLGRGMGNSSQQMGSHGRSELRKCVYVWQKPIA